MLDLESVDEVKCYEFSWKLIGYDCGPSKICSPHFMVNFEITEWYIELDLSKLQNIESSIPFRLQRVPDIGPVAVTLDVTVTVKLNGYEKKFENPVPKVFNENMENYWTFDIYIPPQKLESKQDDFCWLTPKTLTIDIEMKSPLNTDEKKCMFTLDSLKKLRKDLKDFHDGAYNHDLKLKVLGTEFHLHKYILHIRWPKLASLLNIGDPGLEQTIEFSGIPPTILKYFLQFAYYGDLEFMYHLDEIDGGFTVFDLAKKYNFYRLTDKIIHLSPKCSSSQMLQSYRTSFNMKFTNVLSTEKAVGDFKTCDIPLKPRLLPKSSELKDAREIEKFQQHIRFLNLRIYVDKGPLGYNWLMFSIVLGKLPANNSVTIKCKLYVVGEKQADQTVEGRQPFEEKQADQTVEGRQPFEEKRADQTVEGRQPFEEKRVDQTIEGRQPFEEKKADQTVGEKKADQTVKRRQPFGGRRIDQTVEEREEKYLLTEQHLIFDKKTEVSFKSPLTKDKVHKRYRKISQPVITWEELTDKSKNYMRKRQVTDAKTGEKNEEKDIYFRFELKIGDGEHTYSTSHDEIEIKSFEYDNKIFKDLHKLYDNKIYTNFQLTAGTVNIPVHKAFLAARSKVLNDLIRKKPDSKTLSINIEPDIFQTFIHYIYTAQLLRVSHEKVDEFISVAEEYKMECLKKALYLLSKETETSMIS